MTASAPLDVHVVPHTHWDREWYHPLGRFRQRLVALVDELLDAPPPAGESFLLDGQAVVLEDYLHVRPDRAAPLAALLRERRLEAGPWYVLADELIPGAEALVRNLLAGRQALRALGAEAPPVLYCPDSFGHPAALPALAAGFGCPMIVLWRGYGSRRWPSGDTVRWRSAGGEGALVFHLPRDGYEYGSSLPPDEAAASDRWRRMRAELGSRSRTGVLLVQHGADHHARQRRYDDAVAALDRAARPDRVHRSSLAAFAAEVERRAKDIEIPEIAGELRDSYGYTWNLQGTFATRAHQKRANAAAERLLVREAEPWAELARRLGAPARKPLLDAAWRTLLRCHPHDTLCGCSIDAVAQAMDARLDDARVQGEGIRDDSLLDVIGHDPVEARERKPEWRSVLVVRNAAPRARGGVVEAELLTFVQDVPVGPGSAGVTPPRASAPRPAIEGGDVPHQLLGVQLRHDRTESPRHYPDDDLVDARHVVAWVPAIPGYGVRALEVGTRRRGARGAGPPEPVWVDGRVMDNGLLRASVEPDGAVHLRTADGRLDVRGLLRVQSRGDLGDLYTASLVGDWEDAAFLRSRVVRRGPLRAELETRWRLRLPARRAAPRPRPAVVSVDVTVRLVLDAASSLLRVIASGENRAQDHRVRLLFALGLPGSETWADAALGPVRREPLVVDGEDLAKETPPPTAPLHRWVARLAEHGGAALISDGLAEYEATEDGGLAVTLLRAVGELSRNDLAERPGHAGWPTPTPGAQCPGPFAGGFALLPLGARDARALSLIERAADDALLPLTGTTLRSSLGTPVSPASLELEGDGLTFGACKASEDGAWTVLRCVNVSDATVQGTWRLPGAREAMLARLDETPLAPLEPREGELRFEAPPRATVTILVR